MTEWERLENLKIVISDEGFEKWKREEEEYASRLRGY